MTGTVTGLASSSRTGTITTPDGSRLFFAAAAVLGDFDALAVGHRVSFELEREGMRRIATRVFHEPMKAPVPSRKPDAPPDLRYAGFQQAANLRVYRFNIARPGNSVQHSIMLDVTLLLKHHVGMQEIPALCVSKLTADLKTSPELLKHQLGDDDLRQFASLRAEASERRASRHSFAGRRGAPPPGPVQGKHIR